MVEEVVIKSWGSRIKDAFVGILVGIALIGAAIALAFWNERHGLRTAQSLVETEHLIISVPNGPIEPHNNLKVVYFSGMATTQDILHDKELGIAENAIGLSRIVEMYQWKQNEETRNESQLGGSEKQVTTYSYSKVWSSSLYDSSNYKADGHDNPAMMPISSKHQYANTVKVGDFVLPLDLVKQISQTQRLPLDNINLQALEAKLNKPVQVVDNELYAGKNYEHPQIGDMRIRVDSTPAQTVSVIGEQSDNTVQAYQAKAGEPVILLNSGQHSYQDMIQNALDENKILTWILRAVTLIMMIAGFAAILGPIVVLADVLPILGTLAGFGTGFVALLCGFVLWTIITAIAWFAIRPWLSAGLVAIGAGLSYWLYQRKKARLQANGDAK